MTGSTVSKILDRVYGYPQDVLGGSILACEKNTLACQRFLRELDRSQHDPAYPWRFDERLATRPIEFMERFLVPTKGDYDKLELMPWQCFVEGNLYGWVSKETGYRRFREGLVIVGTGNGKSTIMSGNSTFGACKDGERGADIYLLANSKEQAGIVFEECRAQIKASPFLAPRFRTLRDGVYYDKANATIKARASDSRRLDGLNPHMGIFDEIHEYLNWKLINIIKRKTTKRKQPLIIYITTMGTVLDGPLMQLYDLFTDAMIEGELSPEIADRLFAFICELDKGDDIEDSGLWIKANPSLGTLLDRRELELAWERAKKVPEDKSDFITKQLNVTVDKDDVTFIESDILQKNQELAFPVEDLVDYPCYGGFDLSAREDFTAAALEFPLGDGRVFVLQHTWVPQRKVNLDNEKIPYHEWAMKGWMTIVPGDYIKQELVFQWFVKMSEIYSIQSIGYDPANAIWLQRMLEGHGFKCEIVRQGPITLNDPMKDIRELFLAGKVITNDDRMLRWYTRNVRLRNDPRDKEKQNWMPTKRNRYRKIDGFMAWLDAHTIQMQEAPVDGKYADPSVDVYDLR